MKGLLICIQTDGALSAAPITAPPHFTTLRTIVQGSIEVVPYFDIYKGERCVAFCNEHGKLEGLPLNAFAQEHWRRAQDHNDVDIGDVLVGNIAIVTGDDELIEAL